MILNEDPDTVFLKPGELVVAETPTTVTTLLGSCVAVTMYSPLHRLGAICHALLPHCRKESSCHQSWVEGGKYVECAIRLMLEGLEAHGVHKCDIEAKIFGGSDMFETEGTRPGIGEQNIDTALRRLEEESLRLVTRDVGGRRGRKIIFNTHTGEVFLKRLRKTEI